MNSKSLSFVFNVQTVKQHYRKHLLEYVISQMDTTSDPQAIMKSIVVLMVVHWLKNAVRAVKSSIVVKCFKKAGVVLPSAANSSVEPPVEPDQWDPEDDVPLAELMQRTQSLLQLPEPMTVEEYQGLDNNCPSHDPIDSNWESRLVQKAAQLHQGPTADSSDEEQEAEQPDPKMTDSQVMEKMANLRDHFLQRNYPKTLGLLLAMQQEYSSEKVSKTKKQTTLTSFFKPKV